MKEEVKNIFISYSHKDSEICSKISSILDKRSDNNVWYDNGLVGGQNYRRKIAEVIRDSGYFVILLSESSIHSDWVLDEVEYAKKLRKKILPIWIEDVELPDDLDMILQRYHSLFWYLRTSDSQFEKSLNSVFEIGEEPKQKQVQEGFGNQFSESVNQKMKVLLTRESQEKYSECYSPENAVLLGAAYLYGGTWDTDREKAHHYFRTAMYSGSIDAEAYLLRMKLKDRETDTWDVPEEEFCQPIIARMKELAEQGSVPAKLYMGNFYWSSLYGCPHDLEKSAALYEECARMGNARAQYIMASNYYYGDGVPKDYELAKMYANLALEQKFIYAWRRWGKFYRDGRCVQQDYKKARFYYEKGAKMGDYNCYNKIADMYYHGWGCDVDYEASFRYFQKGEKAPASSQNYSIKRAKMALGRCYENGQGVEKNLEEAVQKYQEGYRHGSFSCKMAYLRCSSQLNDQKQEEARNGEQS